MDLTSRFPPELWFQILELLDTQDIRALSAICSTMSKWLAPRLFSNLRLSSKMADLQPMVSFLKRHGHVVDKITYESFLFPRKDGDDEKEGVLCLSPILQDLLAGNGVPNLKTIALSFYPDDNFMCLDENAWVASHKEHYADGSIYIHQIPESMSEVHKAEYTYQWRADIQGVFDAISQNTTLQHLEIQDLLPRQCSTWRTKKWQNFLGRLSSLKLKIWGGENGAGWHSNTLEGYQDFVKQLHPNFFKYLTELKQLHLISDKDNALGCEGYNHSPLPISAEDLPNLEDLELENWFIDPALQNFLSARKDIIHRLVLTNCNSAKDDIAATLAENPISWATFFRGIRDLQPPNLTQFVVTNGALALDWRENMNEDEQIERGYNDEERAHVETIRRQLRENKNLRLFAYASLSDKYGDAYTAQEVIMKSFEDGEDQREYDALVQLVTRNAGKGTG